MNKQQLIELLRSEGFSDKILKVFSKIKRENFVSENLREYAYENEPLPIGEGATISQPYTIAFMLDLMELDKLKTNNPKILEIGSGSGYVLALINEICKSENLKCKIYGIERIKELAEKSQKSLKKHRDIKIICGNGSEGMKNKKFSRILTSAAFSEIPRHLFNQLDDKGILVCPVKNSIFQIKKIGDRIMAEEFPGFVFVPMVEKKA